MKIAKTLATAGSIATVLVMTAGPSQASTTPVPDIISNGVVGICMSAPLAGGYAKGSACPGGFGAPALATELWLPTLPVGTIVSKSGRCLTATLAFRHVRTERCTESLRQEWSVNGYELRNDADRKCLDLHKDSYLGRLRLTQCDNGDGTQNWYFTPSS
jgi:hypothetical protein